jgi:hypothetical protein
LGNSIIAMARVPTDRARASELRDMIVCVADDANQPEMVQQTARDVLRSLEGVA